MPYFIVREDGERFIVPSYRDVITVKTPLALKKELLMLCKSYGDYVCVQRINNMKYEAAFSSDPGYLLGESIWYQLKRPTDLIYCEAISGTNDGILTIVKDGSVYLDGRFPLESIPEELVIFLTQESHFEIYIYGNVPISQLPEEGKFSFEESQIKSFTVLEKPLFPTLPLLKAYQLQLIDPVLHGLGIGVFPIKKMLVSVVIVAVLLFMWSLVSTTPEETVSNIIAVQINPFQSFEDALSAPAPDVEINALMAAVSTLFTMPGWQMKSLSYANGKLTAVVASKGTSLAILEAWASHNNAEVAITPGAVNMTMKVSTSRRMAPRAIYPLQQVIESLTDKLAFVYPGNVLQLGAVANKGSFVEEQITINISDSTPSVISLIGQQLKDMPLVLQSIALTSNNGSFSGTIILKALGS